MTECDYCTHVEMCGWRKSLEERGCDFFDDGNRWVPVSKRLPDKLKDVLVAFVDAPNEYDVAYMRKTFNGVYKGQGAENEWVSSMGETTYADYEISAWMPIPEYREGE